MYFDGINLYKGFLISKDISSLRDFNNYKLTDEYHLLVSKDYQLTKIKNENKSIYLIGYGFDIRNSSNSIETILYNLIETSNFHEELEYLNGRFVLIFVKDNRVIVSTDAGGLKPVFYSKQTELVSSHEFIIKTINQKHFKLPIEINEEYRRGFLDQTSFKKIYKLSPNNEIELNDFKTKRIFPLSNNGEAKTEDIISEMSPYIDEINNWLHHQDNKRFSLTGGIDSRISLALAKPIIEELKFFTYLKPLNHIQNEKRRDIYSKDEKIVQDLAENLRIEHEFFTINKEKKDRNYYKKLRQVVSSNHSYALSKYFQDNIRYKNGLHIKSTIQSIAKASFEKELYESNDFNTLVNGSKRWAKKELIRGEDGLSLIDSVSEFMKRTDLTLNNIYDYHILDILFMESRLGNFQSIITQETDNTLEVFNYFNSRKLISLLLQPNLEERQSEQLSSAVINHFWPMLNFFGVNEETNLYMEHKKLKEKIVRDKEKRLEMFQIDTTSNLGVIKDIHKAEFIIQPNNIPIKPNENYSFKIINNSVYNKVLNIKSKYNNIKGRNIFTLIFDGKEVDIVDAFKGEYIVIKPGESQLVTLSVKKERKRISWLDAATVILTV